MFAKVHLGKWFLAIALLLAISAEVADYIIHPVEKKQIATAQQELNKLEDKIKRALATISGFQKTAEFHEFFIHPGQENQGITYFFLSNDSLLYWSDNKRSLSTADIDSIEDESVIRLPNGIYETFIKRTGAKKIVGLLLLRKEYAYENKYLINRFNPNLKLGDNADIVLNDSIGSPTLPGKNNNAGVPLFSSSGKKLFSVVFSEEAQGETSFGLQSWLYLLSYLFLLAGVLLVVNYRKSLRISSIFLLSVFLSGLRLAMIVFQWPAELYQTDFFSPNVYASSLLFNSIGDLFLNAVTLFCMMAAFALFVSSTVNKMGNWRKSKILFGFLLVAMVFPAWLIHNLIAGLIINSKISFESPIERGIDTNLIVALLSIMLILWSYLMLLFSLVKIFLPRKRPLFFSFRWNLLGLLFFSFYILFSILYYSREKEDEDQRMFASRLDTRQDHLAEYLFEDVEKHISRDSIVRHIFKKGKKVNEGINKRLQQVYFKGYWSKFDVSVRCFDGDSHPFDSTSSQSLLNFQAVVNERGKETFCDKLFFLPDESGQLHYLAILPLDSTVDSTAHGTIVLSLTSHLIQSRTSGFPELFVSNRLAESSIPEMEYSFARYNNDSLVYVYGNYPYSFTPINFSKKIPETGKETFLEADNFNHFIFKPSASTLIIVSRPSEPVFSALSLLSYILLLFSLFFFLVAGFVYLIREEDKIVLSLKQRVRSSIVALVILSFLLTVSGTIVYVMKKYDTDQDQNILSRLNSLWFVLYDNIRFQSNLSSLHISEWSGELDRLSDNLNMDFNLYDEKGNIFYSSEGKIFDQGIISTRMNPEALFEMDENDRTQYVHPENVGNLNYIAAYAPFTGRNGDIIGYLNLPYFEKQNELKKEITGFVSALINIYVLLLVIAIFLALFISSRITRPLLLIQEKLRKSSGFLSATRSSEHATIDWEGNDEIGELVREYNRMVSELGESAEKLARSERESAWREMAQQVAHEIKNPLTPMKLSVQHLQRAWNERRENIDELFNKISKTLIEQINVLSNIATEFSNFAKMPKAQNEITPLQEVIQSSINLFDFASDGIRIEYKDDKIPRQIFADKEQVIRVFSNLIKNAIQSIDGKEGGKISLDIKTENNHHVIVITDNGKGIATGVQSKIFTPYFTTKTSGTGLGLAIVKSIIETMGGSIRFESEEGKGTKFFVVLPTP